MALFRLIGIEKGIEYGSLVHARKAEIELERHLESWLESSPWAIAQEPLFIIARQPTAVTEDQRRYPDLMGLDREGNLVVIELKKGKTPRDVVAQILEYAAWAKELSSDEILGMAAKYLVVEDGHAASEVARLFCDAFESDEMPETGHRLRLYIAAEEITTGVANVCRFLRTSQNLDIGCVEYTAHKTDAGEIVVVSNLVVGQEEVDGGGSDGPPPDDRPPVYEIVADAVRAYTGGDPSKHFAPRDIERLILSKYPDFKTSNVSPRLIADCVNHSSRHHYPGGKYLYWWVARGEYKLYEPGKDDKNT